MILIDGSTADNYMEGGAGNDVLSGLEGSDTLYGNDGDDTLTGGDGDDFLYGGNVGEGATAVGFGSGQVVRAPGAGNNSLGTAIDISNEFALNFDADIISSTTIPHVSIEGEADGGEIHYYMITIGAPGVTITLDIDYGSNFGADASSMDAYLELYNDTGGLLAADDDSSAGSDGAGGSVSGLDSYLVYTFAAAGTYFIAVGTFPSLSSMNAGDTYELASFCQMRAA